VFSVKSKYKDEPQVFSQDSQFQIKNVLCQVLFQHFLLDMLSLSFRHFCLHVIHQLTIFNVPVVLARRVYLGSVCPRKGFIIPVVIRG